MDNTHNKASFKGNGPGIVNSGIMATIGGKQNTVKKDRVQEEATKAKDDGKKRKKEEEKREEKKEEKKEESKKGKGETCKDKEDACESERKKERKSKKEVAESSEIPRMISTGHNQIHLPAPGASVNVELISSMDSPVAWYARRTSHKIQVRPTEGIIEAYGSTDVKITAKGLLNDNHHRVSFYTALRDNSEDLPEERLVLPVVKEIAKPKDEKKKEGKKKD